MHRALLEFIDRFGLAITSPEAARRRLLVG
jgi:hypothetical protein